MLPKEYQLFKRLQKVDHEMEEKIQRKQRELEAQVRAAVKVILIMYRHALLFHRLICCHLSTHHVHYAFESIIHTPCRRTQDQESGRCALKARLSKDPYVSDLVTDVVVFILSTFSREVRDVFQVFFGKSWSN